MESRRPHKAARPSAVTPSKYVLGPSHSLSSLDKSTAASVDDANASFERRYKIERTIGEGAFGQVKLARHRATKQMVCVCVRARVCCGEVG